MLRNFHYIDDKGKDQGINGQCWFPGPPRLPDVCNVLGNVRRPVVSLRTPRTDRSSPVPGAVRSHTCAPYVKGHT